MVSVIVPAVPLPASSLMNIYRHQSFLFILGTSQHPSTLWVECQDKVRLDSPRNFPCSRDIPGGQGALKDQSSIPSTLSHSNLRRCKFYISWWWQIRGEPDLTTQILLEGLRGRLIRLNLHSWWLDPASWKNYPIPTFSSSKACSGIQNFLYCTPKALTVWQKTLCRPFFFFIVIVCTTNSLIKLWAPTE